MWNKIKTSLTAFWRKVPKPLRSGWITAWVTFTGTALAIVVGILPVLAEAISTGNYQPFFDHLSVAATLAISAATGFFSGLVNAIYRWINPIAQAYRTDPPPSPE